MILQIDQQTKIENPRNYLPSIVERVKESLVSGVDACPDTKRKDFYNVEIVGHVYFIHLSPRNGKVMLLARWLCRSLPRDVQRFEEAHTCPER
jgi:hypothetical protein